MEIVILIIVLVLLVVGGGFAAVSHRNRLRGGPPDGLPPAGSSASGATAVLDRTSPKGGSDLLEPPVVDLPPGDAGVEPVPDVLVEPEPATFRDRLGKARASLAGHVRSILSRGVDEGTWDELEEALITADVGVPTTMAMLEGLRAEAEEENITEGAELVERLKLRMKERLGGHDLALAVGGSPSVWLFVGVNGVGKTTTIGKLARREVTDGKKVVLAAGDTFRAAAAEQLGMWAQRADAEIVRGAEGADPSSVIFDAIEHAASSKADIVLADTAGRLHTKTNLMEELSKVRRVAEKGAGTVTEVLLVIDATTGQNGLTQARQFTEAVAVSGIVLTKLDGSARGGIVVAIQSELGIPVKLVGLGEGADDLVEFDAGDFVDALFATT